MSKYIDLLQKEHDIGEQYTANVQKINFLSHQQQTLKEQLDIVISQINAHPENPRNVKKAPPAPPQPLANGSLTITPIQEIKPV